MAKIEPDNGLEIWMRRKYGMLTQEQVERIYEFYKTDDNIIALIGEDREEYQLCKECPLKDRCPLQEELAADEDAVPYNNCVEIIESYILTGEIVDRRKQ